MSKGVGAHKWQFKARFRRQTFGWKSQPAIKRVQEAVSEIKRVARTDPVLAGEGAVSFLERVSPALEHVDSSSGAIGSAVNTAIVALVKIIAKAPADPKKRDDWLERLFEAHADDGIPYIEILTDFWGELCVSPEVASQWASRLLDVTRMALSSDKDLHGHFHGSTACLASLFASARFDELLDIVTEDCIWPYRQWAVKALAAQGKKAEALRYAESCRNPWANDREIDRLCEEILISSGFSEEAYRKYGLSANRKSTYLAWFRAVAKKYPHKTPAEVLEDLVAFTPGEEGKWFAAAKSAELFQEAIVLANRTPCSPQTLTRAARDFAQKNPDFAVESGLTALRWLVEGYGYEITGLDVSNAYSYTMKAADNAGRTNEIRTRIHKLVSRETVDGQFVRRILSRQLELSS